MKILVSVGLLALTILRPVWAEESTNTAAAPVPQTASAASYFPSGYYTGVNLSGAEFGSGNVYNKDYTFPQDAEFEYFKGKGMRVIRLPFKWERLQPELLGEFDPTNLTEIDRCIATAKRLGLVLILDPHNFGKRKINGNDVSIGDPGVPDSAFNDLWARLAKRYQNEPLVWLALMNEPHDQTAEVNARTMQSALNAIRATGAKNFVLVPGTSWTGAHSWVSSGNGAALENFKDTANNFAFEVHQYLDQDHSGTHPEVVKGKGAICLGDFTAWAQAHKVRGFLGESGWDKHGSNPQANLEGDALLGSMDPHRDVWLGYTYWAAGPWWGDDMFSVEPDNLSSGKPVNHPQMQVLQKHQ